MKELQYLKCTENKVSRYSVLEKKDFLVMKINFYNEIENGFEMISSYFRAIEKYNRLFRKFSFNRFF